MSGMLSNRRAIITGGASGIGRVVAEAMIDAGATVAVCDVSPSALDDLRRASPMIHGFVCDVAVPDQVRRFIEDAVTALGGVDILVNNAGIAGPTAPIDEIGLEDWNATITVNLTAQFYCASLVVPHLRRQRSGSIVNLSSVAGRLGFPNRTPYAASKWGVIGLTQSLAMELGPDGIRVNAILPGPVAGDRLERVLRDRATQRGVSLDSVRAEAVKAISLRKFIDAQEIADLIVFICSEKGRSISGQSLSVCGNMETMR